MSTHETPDVLNFVGRPRTQGLSWWLLTLDLGVHHRAAFCIKRRQKICTQAEESLEHLKPAKRVCRPPCPILRSRLRQPKLAAGQVAVSALDPAYRIVLRDIEGLTAKEVASVVGLSVSAVKSLRRARGQLRASLTGRYPFKSSVPDIRKIFSEHLEGDLSPDICATIRAHVSACTACARECDGLKAVLNACSTAPCEVPAGVQEQVKRALRAVMD